jgi:hypothetical protein
MVTIRIPVPSGILASNLLGVVGLLAIVVAIGALAGWPWALLAGGVFAVALTALAQAGARESAGAQPTSLNDVRRQKAA